MSGRTFWFARDVARHRRGLMVELQDDFGPVALAVDDVLCALAKEQNAGGCIREGFSAVAREAGMAGRADEVRVFMTRATEVGWLDDLEVDADGRRFRVRVSGWKADQDKGTAAWRQAKKRAEQAEQTVTDRDESRDVSESHLTAQHSTAQENNDNTVELDRARQKNEQIVQVFTAWVEATERDAARTKLTPDRRRRIEKALASHGLDDCLAAVRHIGADAWARGENDRKRRFDDIEHALGNTERIERWRDQQPRPAPPATPADEYQATRRRRSAALQNLIGGPDAA